nr:hypothetical protein Iba_chr11bCG13860 [Ipomoea batatas]
MEIEIMFLLFLVRHVFSLVGDDILIHWSYIRGHCKCTPNVLLL